MQTSLNNVRYALRTMGRDKPFAAAALLTLSIGIGATTAVFSIVYGVLLRPLPYPEPDRLVRVYEEHPGAAKPPGQPPLSNTVMEPWRDRTTTLEDLAAYYGREYTVMFNGEARRIYGAEASASLFSLLRATPQAGRLLSAGDETSKANGFVVLSDRLWRERFGGRADAVGKALMIDGRPHAIVGVAMPGFHFPDQNVQLWTPYDDPTKTDASVQGGMWLAPTLGRLKPGVTIAQAEAEGTTVARSMKRPPVANMLFGTGGPVQVRVETVARQMTSDVRPALLVLAGSVAFLLLIACANVASLFLSRGVARQRELAVRAAIGASRGQLAAQLLTESMVYACGGGAIGLVFAWMLVQVTPLLAPADFPRLDALGLDWTTGLFAVAVSFITALLSGLLPAVRGARFDLASSLHPGDGAAGGGFSGAQARHLRSLLVAAESAFATLLLIGAALLGRSFVSLTRVDPGYDSHGVLTARVYPPAGAPGERIVQFSDALLARLRADGRVVAAGAGNMIPFNDTTWINGFTLPESIGAGKPTSVRTLSYLVTPGYAEALGLRLREGRLLTAADASPANARIVVNEEFVRQYLSSGPVAGRSFAGGPYKATTTEIVGVVNNVLKDGNAGRPQPEIYVLQNATYAIGDELNLAIRTSGDPAAVASTLREAVPALDPAAAIGQMAPLASGLSASVAQPRFATTVLGVFAAIALVLASIGTHGVLSYAVAQRRREFGLRLALGASRRQLMALVVRDGLVVASAGLAAGVLAATGLSRLLAGLLFGVTPLDVAAYAVAPALLLPVAAAACLIPALRAAAVDPAMALRGE